MFKCSEAVIWWVEEDYKLLWRVKTDLERKRPMMRNELEDRVQVLYEDIPIQKKEKERCLAVENLKPVVLAEVGGREQVFVTNLQEVQKHKAFSPIRDQKLIKLPDKYELTRTLLSVPIKGPDGYPRERQAKRELARPGKGFGLS